MIDPSLPLQKSVNDALSAGLGNDVGVYDHVPADPVGKIAARFPYVHIGEDQIVSDADPCNAAATAYVTIHVWSRKPGKVEAKTIMARVCVLLDVKLQVDGFVVTSHKVESGPQHLGGGDGLTSHSVVTFRYRMAAA